jgi:hypothetical protein
MIRDTYQVLLQFWQTPGRAVGDQSCDACKTTKVFLQPQSHL